MEHQERQQQLELIYQALQEKGYNPLGQLVGYLVSGDPTYITNYNRACSKIAGLDRDELMRDIVSNYFYNATSFLNEYTSFGG